MSENEASRFRLENQDEVDDLAIGPDIEVIPDEKVLREVNLAPDLTLRIDPISDDTSETQIAALRKEVSVDNLVNRRKFSDRIGLDVISGLAIVALCAIFVIVTLFNGNGAPAPKSINTVVDVAPPADLVVDIGEAVSIERE